jgi:hypothetical protein
MAAGRARTMLGRQVLRPRPLGLISAVPTTALLSAVTGSLGFYLIETSNEKKSGRTSRKMFVLSLVE